MEVDGRCVCHWWNTKAVPVSMSTFPSGNVINVKDKVLCLLKHSWKLDSVIT